MNSAVSAIPPVTAPVLGIIAGKGDLPRLIIDRCRAEGRAYFVVALHGQTPPATVEGEPHGWVTIGAVGAAVALLRAAGVQELVLAGGVQRPSLRELKPDADGARLLASMGRKLLGGDDALLRAVTGYLEGQGFRLVGTQDVLPEATAPAGLLSTVEPDAQDWADIRHGLAVAHALGQWDIGQAVVVQHGVVLGVEAVEGTERLLTRIAPFVRPQEGGGVLVKACKPQQDRRVDLPAIGAFTVDQAHAAGLRGIAVETGKAVIINAPALTARAQALGLFVVSVDAAADLLRT